MGKKFKVEKEELAITELSPLLGDVDKSDIKYIEGEIFRQGIVAMSVYFDKPDKPEKVKPDVCAKSMLIKADGLEEKR